MNNNIEPKVGQILYNETLDEKGSIKSASLIYIDTEPEPESKNYMVTWIAQMEDFGNGIEVYTDATAGSIGKDSIKRIATDEDILSFIKAIRSSENVQEQIQRWLENIDKSQDYALLLPEEKERLKKLINS